MQAKRFAPALLVSAQDKCRDTSDVLRRHWLRAGQHLPLVIAFLSSLASGCIVGEVGESRDDDPAGDSPTEFSRCDGDSLAHDTFNAFWLAIDREYALFDIRLVDVSWSQLGSAACSQVDDDISDSELFDLLLEMAENFDDGHINLSSSTLDRDEDAWVTEYPHLDALDAIEGNVEDQYLTGDLTYAAADEMAWGVIGDVGYLSITSMDGLSPSEDEEDDVAAADDAMRRAKTSLASTRALIVDVRANGGGWDSVSLAIATHVAGEQTLAWSKQWRMGRGHSDFSPPHDVFIDAAVLDAIAPPVVLLTSGGTFSAAETFALAMRVRDNVRILGERSSGHFSDLTDRTLPNGWELTFSGQRYQAADGINYETRGVPVDDAIAFDPIALMAGTDTMLEAALRQLADE